LCGAAAHICGLQKLIIALDAQEKYCAIEKPLLAAAGTVVVHGGTKLTVQNYTQQVSMVESIYEHGYNTILLSMHHLLLVSVVWLSHMQRCSVASGVHAQCLLPGPASCPVADTNCLRCASCIPSLLLPCLCLAVGLRVMHTNRVGGMFIDRNRLATDWQSTAAAVSSGSLLLLCLLLHVLNR
jgi:hypothetical protein